MRIRVGDRREEHSEDHLVNRCGSYMPPPPPASNILTMNILGFK